MRQDEMKNDGRPIAALETATTIQDGVPFVSLPAASTETRRTRHFGGDVTGFESMQHFWSVSFSSSAGLTNLRASEQAQLQTHALLIQPRQQTFTIRAVCPVRRKRLFRAAVES